MSAQHPKIKNPLIHNGTSQYERLLQYLVPENLPIDDRSLKDLIVTAYRYAQLIWYYDENDQTSGDWQCFWEVEALTFLAVLSEWDTELIIKQYNDLEIAFAKDLDQEDNGSEGGSEEPITNAYDLIKIIYDLALQLEKARRELPDDLVIKKEIEAFIRKDTAFDGENLTDALLELIAYHKAAYDEEYGENLPIGQYKIFFGPLWQISDATAFESIKFNSGYDRESLRALFRQFYQVLVKIRSRANYWFDKLIGQPQLHQPHIALFLTFLRLFRHAQNSLNALTGKHLNYYYEKVLCLERQDAVPDEVHLIFELAKGFDEYLVETGAELLAGKDANGKPLIFEAVEDWVINKTQLAEIKTIFIEGEDQAAGAVYAAADAKAIDANCWRSFGDDINIEKADLGFALSSPQFLLLEGTRTITIRIFLSQDIGAQADQFELSFTTKEGYEEVPRLTAELEEPAASWTSFPLDGEIGIGLRLELNPNFPAVEPLEEIAGIQTQSAWPALKIQFKKDHPEFARVYDTARRTFLLGIGIRNEVSGIKENLVIQNDLGVFNGTQKFNPFGPVPEIGSLFYLGSREAFVKPLDKVTIDFEWIAPPPDFGDHYANYIKNFVGPNIKIDILDQGSFPERLRESLIQLNRNTRTINGTATTNDGKALPGVTVKIFYLLIFDGIQTLTETTTTQEDGTFSFALEIGSGNVLIMTMIFELQGRKLFIESQNVSFSGETSTVDVILRGNVFGLVGPDDTINYQMTFDPAELGYNDDKRPSKPLRFSEYSPALQRGFIRMELYGADFLHNNYPNSLTRQTILAANAGDDAANVPLPEQPYTPATNGISLGYVSTLSVNIGEENDGIERFFHLLPFDGYDLQSFKDPDTELAAPLEVPEINVPPTETNLTTANLYLGLQDLKPGQNVSFLVQAVEGSEIDAESRPPLIVWSYLIKGNQWKKFSTTDMLMDTSRGLSRTGIIQLTTSKEMVRENTLLNPQLHWIRASVVADQTANPPVKIAALPCLSDIRTQVILARFENRANDLAHLAQPLPAKTISKLLNGVNAVKKVEQPFGSFDGRLPEDGNEFYRRVSERLRHRDRAITIWDYERLLLEKFPKLYRAKCLNHTNAVSELAPGFVTIAVVPDLRRRNDELRAEPRFSYGDLLDMEDYLRSKTTLFVSVQAATASYRCSDRLEEPQEKYLRVVNPDYEPVRLSFEVQFMPGVDAEFHRFRLDEALQSFLAPWLKDPEADINFTNRLYKSQIIHFIESQDYVDAVGEFEAFHATIQSELDSFPDECRVIGDQISPSRSHSILTTYLWKEKPEDQTHHHILVSDKKDWCITNNATLTTHQPKTKRS